MPRRSRQIENGKHWSLGFEKPRAGMHHHKVYLEERRVCREVASGRVGGGTRVPTGSVPHPQLLHRLRRHARLHPSTRERSETSWSWGAALVCLWALCPIPQSLHRLRRHAQLHSSARAESEASEIWGAALVCLWALCPIPQSAPTRAEFTRRVFGGDNHDDLDATCALGRPRTARTWRVALTSRTPVPVNGDPLARVSPHAHAHTRLHTSGS